MYSPDPVRPTVSRGTVKSYLWPSQRLARALLLFPLVSALLTVADLLWDGEKFSLDYSIADSILLGWNLLAPLALALLVLQCARRFPLGLSVTAVGCAIYLALTVWLLASELLSDSSMAGLMFLSLPLMLGGVVGVFTVVAMTVDVRRRPKSPRAQMLPN